MQEKKISKAQVENVTEKWPTYKSIYQSAKKSFQKII